MVFGNMGDDCATGVCFTRDPSTGENVFYGEYLVNAQGEDVVAGIRTPQPLSEARAPSRTRRRWKRRCRRPTPNCCRCARSWRQHYRDMQDIEFTVQQNKLYMLQTRNGKRTAAAALRIAVDMAREGLIDQRRGGAARQPGVARPVAASDARSEGAAHAAGQGPAGQPGRRLGRVVFTADEAESRAQKGEAVILVRIETSPEDIHGMHAARGILTTRGGMTSHAAVVARGMGRPCVAGAGGICGRLQRADAVGRRARRCGPARSSPSTAPPARCSSARWRWSSRRCPAISPR